jgi:hypothetical protein
MAEKRRKAAGTDTTGRRPFLHGSVALAGLLNLGPALSTWGIGRATSRQCRRPSARILELSGSSGAPSSCLCREEARREMAQALAALEVGVLRCDLPRAPYCPWGRPLSECRGWDASQP